MVEGAFLGLWVPWLPLISCLGPDSQNSPLLDPYSLPYTFGSQTSDVLRQQGQTRPHVWGVSLSYWVMLLDSFCPVLFRARVSGNFVVRFRVVTRASTCISSLSLRQVLGQGGSGGGEAKGRRVNFKLSCQVRKLHMSDTSTKFPWKIVYACERQFMIV
jgi:hypothetical protein